MARGRNSRSGGSSKSKKLKPENRFVGNVPSANARSVEEHLAAIDHHWSSLTPKSKTFLLGHKSIDTLTWDALMQFWSLPDQTHLAQMTVTVGTCNLLAYEYYHIKAYANAAILACNGAFLQQCINISASLEVIKAWPADKITNENLPYFFNARDILSKSPEFISKYLSKVLPLRYQSMLQLDSHVSHVPGMGYVDLISNDWNATSHASNGKHQRACVDEKDMKVILSNEENGSRHEKIVKPSMTLKTVFNSYADECGESLRTLRFIYNGNTLFLSSLGQKTACDLGMKNYDVISIYRNSSSQQTQEMPPQQQQDKKQKKKNKYTVKKVNKVKGKSKATSQQIFIPMTEKELKEAHSLLLSKVHEQAEPLLKDIRQRLNSMSLDCKKPKDRRASSNKKKDIAEINAVFHPNTCGLGGKAGKVEYAVNVGRVENLYISSKRNSIHASSSPSTRSSIVDLHGCSKDEAIEILDSSLIGWMKTAMQGEYPWVIPATIVCGGGNQILSETVESWIKQKKNVANAPKGSLLCQ